MDLNRGRHRGMTEISGHAPPRFAAVKDAFAANFAADEELGARFTLVEAGEVVVDLWAGHADRRRGALRRQDARLRLLDHQGAGGPADGSSHGSGETRLRPGVASIWPEFAAAGKASISIEQLLSHQGGLCGFPERMDPASGSTGT